MSVTKAVVKIQLGLLVACLWGSVPASAAIELTGLFITSKKAMFALVNTDSGASAWVSLGQKFEEYEAFDFEPEAHVLSLRKADQVLRIPLKEAKVKEGNYPVFGTIKTGEGKTIVVSEATLVLGAEQTFPLSEKALLHLTVQRLPDGTLSYQPSIEATNKEGEKTLIVAPTLRGGYGRAVSLTVGDYQFEFKPRAP